MFAKSYKITFISDQCHYYQAVTTLDKYERDNQRFNNLNNIGDIIDKK